MLQNRLAKMPGLAVRPPLTGKTPDRRARAIVAGTILGGAWDESGGWADADVPVFALLRAQIGLPIEDARWWPAPGRHVASVRGDVTSPTALSDPSIELLERTLAGLRAWHPVARVGGVRPSA